MTDPTTTAREALEAELKDALDAAHNAPREGVENGRFSSHAYARAANRAIAARAALASLPPAPVASEGERFGASVRKIAAQLAAERVQGWANPLVATLVDAADFLEQKQPHQAGLTDVVLSAPREDEAARLRTVLKKIREDSDGLFCDTTAHQLLYGIHCDADAALASARSSEGGDHE